MSLNLKRPLASLALAFIALAPFSPFCRAANFDDTVKELMTRQEDASSTYDQVSYRIKAMDKEDPRAKAAESLLGEAQTARDNFQALDVNKETDGSGDEVHPSQNFLDKEKAFNLAIAKVNQSLVAAVQPGAEKPGKEGTVPKGSLTEAFLPQVIKIMFQFASLAILIGFITAGVMMVITYDNETYVTNAKRILIYSLIGFAFVSLAYAIVKAITKVNFFGIV